MKTTALALAVCILSLFSTTSATAQKEFVWDYYKVSIELPDDFKVTKNTDNEFECEGDGMQLYMYVFDDGDVTLADMNKATRKLGRDLKFEMKDEHYELDYNGFKGEYILGYKDGLQVMVAGLINPKNATNFFIVIIFEDGDHVAQEDGIAILNSLEAK
ncbi:MAG: hypothetical protein JNL70_18620 [Saprospiraceae bacterium]|nr:hypothetical protein [Saprospiraceae bacterium]